MLRPERSAKSIVQSPRMRPRPHSLLVVPTLFLVAAAACAQQAGSLVQRGSTLQAVDPDPGERELRLTPVVRAVQRSADSVVSVYLQAANALARGGPITEGQGSGVILDEAGLVITNWHVVAPVVLADSHEQRLELAVKLRDGRARNAKVLSSSATRDLALLQIDLENGEKVKPVEIGRSSDLMIGETLIAIGNPQGHANTVTSGVLSATGRTIQVRAPDGSVRSYSDLLQTDAAINQGNSGGALLDITGRLVGINNAMAMGAENIGFAIPVDVVRQVFEKELVQSDSFAMSADAPWLGLEVAEKQGAVVVVDVADGSPAATAGVRPGDVLETVADQQVRSSLDYLRRIVEAKPREPFALALRRGNDKLVARPVPVTRAAGATLAAIGAEFEEVSLEADPALVRATTIAFYRGSGIRRFSPLPAVLRIVSVESGSPAEAIGLQRGDVLLAVFGATAFGDREYPVTSVRDLAGLLGRQRGKALKIAILRGTDDLIGTLDVRGADKR